MRTKIKFMTNDEQFRQVMKILKSGFKEQCTCENNCFIINDKGIVLTGWAGSTFQECEYEEIDADLFIRTNGSCEESLFDKTSRKFYPSDEVLKSMKENIFKDTVENFVIKALEDENIQLKKKIENLHIALNKKVKKNKNQKEEITRLLKLNQQYKSGISRLVGYSIDDRMPINGYIDFILKQKEGFRESENVLIKMVEELKESWNNEAVTANEIVSDKNFDNLHKEIDILNFIIKYLEGRLNEK
jgi:hypothetical protein